MPERVINTVTKENGYQDDDGKRYVVVETIKIIEFTSYDGSRTIKTNLFSLADGTRIEAIAGDPEAFKVFGSNKVIRKV